MCQPACQSLMWLACSYFCSLIKVSPVCTVALQSMPAHQVWSSFHFFVWRQCLSNVTATTVVVLHSAPFHYFKGSWRRSVWCSFQSECASTATSTAVPPVPSLLCVEGSACSSTVVLNYQYHLLARYWWWWLCKVASRTRLSDYWTHLCTCREDSRRKPHSFPQMKKKSACIHFWQLSCAVW